MSQDLPKERFATLTFDRKVAAPVATLYAAWTAPGAEKRDADPTSAKHALQIAIWRRLPLPVANRLGPLIARGLG